MIGKNMQTIKIDAEKDGDDYYDVAIEVLQGLAIRLSGGHYGPKSERDAALSDAIGAMLSTGVVLPRNY